jgi:hypothetical protein
MLAIILGILVLLVVSHNLAFWFCHYDWLYHTHHHFGSFSMTNDFIQPGILGHYVTGCIMLTIIMGLFTWPVVSYNLAFWV